MESKYLLRSIGDLVEKNKLSEALVALQDLFANNTNLSEVIHQKGRLSGLEDDIRKGVIDYSNASIEKNKIRLAILMIIEKVGDEINADKNLKKQLDLYSNGQLSILNQEHSGKGDNINAPNALIFTKNQSGGKNTIVNKIPQPSISLRNIGYIDKMVSEDLSKENLKLPNLKGQQLYKTYLEFEYNSPIHRSNIDFLVNASSVYHVKMRYAQGMFETSDWAINNKVKGKRFFNPQNGIYELTIYTKFPLINIWDFIRIQMNDIEAEIIK